MSEKCATCGLAEHEHHEYRPVKRPAGCVCAAGEWRHPEKIPPVCDEYQSVKGGNCDGCEHDEECHGGEE